MKKRIIGFLFLISFIITGQSRIYADKSPHFVCVIVIDQFAYHHIKRLSPYFTDGFRTLLKDGVSFENAFHPHGVPTTATGHTTISTGALAKDHGVILNNWIEDGQNIVFAKDNSPESAVFTKKGTGDYGFSAKNLMVDNLSDQMVLSSRPYAKNYVYSISYKARAAIGMGGKLGKSIWFDKKLKHFTSSKAYFKTMPNWLAKFNKTHDVKKVGEVDWRLRFPIGSKPYQFYNVDDYEFTKQADHLAGEMLKIEGDEYDKIFQKTPESNNLLLGLAKSCLDFNFKKMNDADKLLLWVSLSSLDRIGHIYGPYSLEVIDMIYHLDAQLEVFMQYVQDLVGAENVLFVLTGDHGVAPIPEILQRKGFASAKRLDSTVLMAQLNSLVEEKFGIKEIVKIFKANQFYLDSNIKKDLDKEKLNQIFALLKDHLLKQPAIKACWTNQEMEKAKFPKNYFEQLYKNQFNAKRSGDLIFMPQPYCEIIKHVKGTTHRSPYDYDTHVPLIFYQEGVTTGKKIKKKIYMTQVAPTLAKVLKVSNPSAASSEALTKIF
jgi:predicted AlkP superfamily pyrophosphatase or phosphodiesterase